ncbi:MAG: hypothetical protein EA378_10225 [Phycisphaerales bacterium]|nr:MAG: hypothetical protein EA378_10225 [Phycisphaerales bacterium]
MNNPFRREADDNQSFLPEDYVQSKGETRTNLIAVFTFALVMFGVVSAFIVTSRQWESVRAERDVIEAQYDEAKLRIEQLNALEQQRMEMVGKAELTTALIERVPRSVLLAELVTRMPAGVSMSEFHMTSKRVNQAPATPAPATPAIRSLSGQTSGGAPASPARPRVLPPRFEYSLSIRGVAEVNNQIADYLRSLQSCPLLEGVELEFIRNTIEDNVALRSFRIVARLRDDADARSLGVEASDKSPGVLDAGDDIAEALRKGEQVGELIDAGLLEEIELDQGEPLPGGVVNVPEPSGEEGGR